MREREKKTRKTVKEQGGKRKQKMPKKKMVN